MLSIESANNTMIKSTEIVKNNNSYGFSLRSNSHNLQKLCDNSEKKNYNNKMENSSSKSQLLSNFCLSFPSSVCLMLFLLL